jgi:hypothetical protein
MAGLVPAIHVYLLNAETASVDARSKSGHNVGRAGLRRDREWREGTTTLRDDLVAATIFGLVKRVVGAL